jgi:hypothetical protein
MLDRIESAQLEFRGVCVKHEERKIRGVYSKSK